MFDPTIFENIKIVLEGEIYDFDLSGKLLVTERKDLVDLAKMSRAFMIQFKLSNAMREVIAEIHLQANLEDLSKEILEIKEGLKPGAEIIIKFYIAISTPNIQCEEIENKLNQIWSFRPAITQRISYLYKGHKDSKKEFLNEVTLHFGRKIDEDNIGDLHQLIEHINQSLAVISKFVD